MDTNSAIHGLTQNATNLQRGRASSIALWVTQVALAAMFVMAGGSKVAGAPEMVSMFDTIGLGQWLRYLTGGIEIVSGLALLVPSAAVYGALLLMPTMLGAIAANVFILHQSPVMPLVLFLLASTVAWVRRRQLRTL